MKRRPISGGGMIKKQGMKTLIQQLEDKFKELEKTIEAQREEIKRLRELLKNKE